MTDKKMTREEALAWSKEVAGPEFMERLENAAAKIVPFTQEQMYAAAKAEEDYTCKHCGRCVLAGPPCCYQMIYDLWHKAESEVQWLRKIQSKKDKKIVALQQELKALKDS